MEGLNEIKIEKDTTIGKLAEDLNRKGFMFGQDAEITIREDDDGTHIVIKEG